MTLEKLRDYFESLSAKHRTLDNQVSLSYSNYESNEKLAQIKLEKLAIKQQLVSVENQIKTLEKELAND